MQESSERFQKVVMTGGHAGTTALAVIQEIVKRKKKWNIHWIGPQKAHEGKEALTIEAKVFPQYNVTFHPIIAGKLQKKWTRYTLISLLKVPFGFFHALFLLAFIRPQVVMSFGGYASVPVVFCAWLFRIPVILQEQITGLGFANRLALPFANVVALSREEGLLSAKGKGVVLGNPVNPLIASLKNKQKKHSPPTLFIFTGSRGSVQINNAIYEILPKLLKSFKIYHLTGDLDKNKFEKVRNSLTPEDKKRYEVFGFIDPSDVHIFYDKSDILIGRAGANTVSEIMVCGIPSILIPLTWTNYQEQVLNAKAAEKRNIATVLENESLTGQKLMDAILDINKNWMKMIKEAEKDLAILDRNSASRCVDLIEETIV